jgi:hypothetical protein
MTNGSELMSENEGEKPLQFIESEANSVIKLAGKYVSSRDNEFALAEKQKGINPIDESRKLVRDGNHILALAFLLAIPITEVETDMNLKIERFSIASEIFSRFRPTPVTEYEMMSNHDQALRQLSEAFGTMSKVCKTAASRLMRDRIKTRKQE